VAGDLDTLPRGRNLDENARLVDALARGRVEFDHFLNPESSTPFEWRLEWRRIP